ncbi:MAG: trypsin-like peptidase domain-containing protein, partial [Thermoguttaceae bacterium]
MKRTEKISTKLSRLTATIVFGAVLTGSILWAYNAFSQDKSQQSNQIEKQVALINTPESAKAVADELNSKIAEAKSELAELEKTLRLAANAKKILENLSQQAANSNNTSPATNSSNPTEDLSDNHALAQSLSYAFRDASKKVIPATVKVLSHIGKTNMGIGSDLLPRTVPGMPNAPAEGMGTGVIIDSKGIILTNNHVVDGAREVEVELSDGRKFQVADIKVDKRTDIAVLWLDTTEKLPSAEFGDSDALDIGDWVLAIGNP